MMDSNKASASTKNSTNCENDKNKNYKSVVLQADQSDNEVLNSSLNTVPLNGCLSRIAPVASNDSSSQSSKSAKSPAESHNNVPSTSSSSCGKILSNDSVAASSSRTSSNTNNGLDSEGQSCVRHRVCMAVISNAPSTSGTGRVVDNIVPKENRKRPSSLKLNPPDGDEDSSNDTGNDNFSFGSEDSCIYTYRGGEHLADLPSSFFSLDMGLPQDRHLPMRPNYAIAQVSGNVREGGSRVSSPDMDFLEMDFDPGPSCEVDSGEVSSEGDLDADVDMQEENGPVVNVIRDASPENVAQPVQANPLPVNIPVELEEDDVYSHAAPSTSLSIIFSQEDTHEQHQSTWYGPYITHVNVRGEQYMVRRTMLHWAGPVNMHINGDIMPIKETASKFLSLNIINTKFVHVSFMLEYFFFYNSL